MKLYLDDGYRCVDSLLRLSTTIGSLGRFCVNAERGHWVYVSVPRLGSSLLAAFRTTIWQTSHFSHICRRCHWMQYMEVSALTSTVTYPHTNI